jgi:hypothetical protein
MTPMMPGMLFTGYVVIVCPIVVALVDLPEPLVYWTTYPSPHPRLMARLPTSEMFFALLSVRTYPAGTSSGVRARAASGPGGAGRAGVTAYGWAGEAEGAVDRQAAPASAAQTSRTVARKRGIFIVHCRPGRYKKMVVRAGAGISPSRRICPVPRIPGCYPCSSSEPRMQ